MAAPTSVVPLALRDQAGLTLRPYQQEAVTAIARGLAEAGARGQLRAACGSGKTLIAQLVAQRLVRSGTVAVLVPSLALVAQTLTSWRRHHVGGQPLRALAVCSDDTVADAPAHLDDLVALSSGPVTTEVPVIAEWLSGQPAGQPSLIVGTYASADKLAAAVRSHGRPLDLLIADEAHHLAGPTDAATAKVVDSARLPARRRLYMTATPRLNEGTDHNGAGWHTMDDQTVFGPVLYDYPFARAIAEGYLEDYRVVVVGIADAQARNLLTDPDAHYTDHPGGPSLHTIVAQAALAKAREQFTLRRALTFHHYVTDAHEFASTLPATLARLGSTTGLTTAHINGQMDHRQREQILHQLREVPADGWSVVSNVRCLGEGVDVPAVDGVLFAHPKRSTVDIVQAVGRALRRHPDTPGPSTIIIPIVVPAEQGEIGDLDPKDYATIWHVLRALRAHDEPLGTALNHQRSHNPAATPRLPEKITIVLPPGTSTHFLDQLTLLTVRQTTSPWWEGYTRATSYHTEYGHLGVPDDYRTEDGFHLGSWIGDQRKAYRKGVLAQERIAALEALDIVWDMRNR
ncbi:DEAD/DEAH box helicase [Streptomyces sp. N35]|uniref:DEAD/DEAH box helicase n=1 Tax=Streptomyces sp. N35 TaxID=2795730 RepID=UPI0018F670FB|nr:DEAD/DEAH box helicase [Streptomyces sp. N35]